MQLWFPASTFSRTVIDSTGNLQCKERDYAFGENMTSFKNHQLLDLNALKFYEYFQFDDEDLTLW